MRAREPLVGLAQVGTQLVRVVQHRCGTHGLGVASQLLERVGVELIELPDHRHDGGNLHVVLGGGLQFVNLCRHVDVDDEHRLAPEALYEQNCDDHRHQDRDGEAKHDEDGGVVADECDHGSDPFWL